MPVTWVMPAGSAIAIICGAATTGSANSSRWATLPTEVPARFLDGVGTHAYPVHIRCTSSAPTPVSIALTTNTGGRHVVTSADGWADIWSDGQALRIATSTGERTIDDAKGQPLTLTEVSVEAASLARNATAVALRVRLLAPATALVPAAPRHVAWSAIDRLEASDQWRPHDNPDQSPFATRVLATRAATHASSNLPTGDIDLVGFLSELWQPRLSSNAWNFHHRSGAPVAASSLDDYGRSGGLIAYIYDRNVGVEPAPGPTTAARPVAAVPLFEGRQRSWVDARLNAELTLQQLTMAWYGADQRGPSVDSAVSEDTANLHSLLLDQWHPAFAWQIDVLAVIVRGTNRFRFSDDDFADRAPRIIADVATGVASQGIRSQPVVLS